RGLQGREGRLRARHGSQRGLDRVPRRGEGREVVAPQADARRGADARLVEAPWDVPGGAAPRRKLDRTCVEDIAIELRARALPSMKAGARAKHLRPPHVRGKQS